jgi:hypothetical protein
MPVRSRHRCSIDHIPRETISMPRVIPLVLLLALGACANILEPGPALPPDDLPIEFTEAPLETEFSITAGAGSVVVEDRTTTGVCHKHENRGAYREGSVLTVWIAHTGWGSGICPAIGKAGAYRATIRDLDPGTYTVRVRYIGDIGTGSYPVPALEQVVVVP